MNPSPNSFSTVNPATDEVLSVYEYHRPDQIEAFLAEAWSAHLKLRSSALKDRVQLLEQIAEQLNKNASELGKLMSLEMGKTVRDAKAEVLKSVETIQYLARSEELRTQDRVIAHGPRSYRVGYKPLGPILAVMPWNFPVWQVVRVLAPALLAGNSVVLKHADLVSGTAELLTQIVDGSGKYLVNVRVPHEQTEALIADQRVRAVTLTGSVRAGSAVASLAGKHLKKVVLELGGADAYLVFADSDIKKAAALCAASRLINAGQSCISAKRFFVEQSVLETFLEEFKTQFARREIGPPNAETTAVGPLASARHLQSVQYQVDLAAEQGLKLLWRKQHGQEKGSYSDLSLFLGEGTEPIFVDQEIFGPVALVAPFQNEAQAVQLANQSVFGLGGAVFTSDQGRFERLASKLETGMLAWNDFVRSDVRFPFGGVKCSGFGRELGQEGLSEFSFAQTLIV
jgi:acyl-CoA reductase-like NAD-dependent aldehyde dehydrogenase